MKVFDENVGWRRQVQDETLTRWPDDILIADYTHLSRVDWDMSKCIIVGQELETGSAFEVLATPQGPAHIVQVTHPRFDHAINLAALMIADPAQFFADPARALFVGRENELKVQRFPFRGMKEKSKLLAELEAYALTISTGRAFKANARALADELLTNALFNAPVDPSGHHKYFKTPRHTPIELDADASAALFIAHDDQVAFIGCEDSYGSLVTQTALTKIEQNFKKGAGQTINFGEGGSGIGCYLMVEQSADFTMAVSNKKKTVVACGLLHSLPARVASAIPKNVHIIPNIDV